MGFIDLLPAISQLLGKVSFKKMRSQGGVLVSCNGDKGKVLDATFTSKKPTKIKVKNNFASENLTVASNGEKMQLQVKRGELFELDLCGTIVIKIN